MEVDADSILAGAKRFQYILGAKARQDKKLCGEITAYFSGLGYDIPADKDEFKEFCQAITDTDPIQAPKLVALLKMYKSLRFGYSVGALFVHPETGGAITQTLFHLYNKHRCSHVWNWRKQSILRKYYKGYISEHWEDLKKYVPAHLVLTLRRDKETGLYNGDKFYGHTLIKHYNELRKTAIWKAAVYAGEYGLETKKGKNAPGYHIHIHSLVMVNRRWNFEALEKCSNRQIIESIKLLNPETKTFTRHTSRTPKQDNLVKLISILQDLPCNLYTLKQIFRKQWIKATDSNQIHLERLYTWEIENGKIKTYTKTINGKKFELPVKKYLTVNSPPEDFMRGVLECIKYHFKGDTFQNEDKSTDIDALGEVLAATKGKRLYSRFGAWYADPYNVKKEADQIEEETAVKSIKEMFNELIHPITKQPVKDFCLVSYQPHERNFFPKDAALFPCESHETDLSKFIFLNENLPVGELIKNLITGKRAKVRKPPLKQGESVSTTYTAALKAIREGKCTEAINSPNPLEYSLNSIYSQ